MEYQNNAPGTNAVGNMPPKRGVPVLMGALILLLVALVLVGGVFAYEYYLTDRLQRAELEAQKNYLESLRLQQNSVQTPSPTPSPIAGWATFANTDYGFEIKYPSDWTLEKSLHGGNSYWLFISPTQKMVRERNLKDCSDNNDTTICNADGTPIDVTLNVAPPGTPLVPPPQLILGDVVYNNITFTKYSAAFAGELHLITVHNNVAFDFGCVNELVCDQMLSTFKFTK